MARQKPRLSDFIVAPLKIGVLAALPLMAGVEVGTRASAGDSAGAQIVPDGVETFDITLAKGYRSLAESLDARDSTTGTNDWADSQYFSIKAMAADRGENEGPEESGGWSLDPDTKVEIDAARTRLIGAIGALQSASYANADAAEAVADAQVNFDCWVERSEEAERGAMRADECHHSFEAALGTFKSASRGEGLTAATDRTEP